MRASAILAALLAIAAPASAQDITIPFTIENGLIYADVTMNGNKVHALIDTGANIAVVPSKVSLNSIHYTVNDVTNFSGAQNRVENIGKVVICVDPGDQHVPCVNDNGIAASRQDPNHAIVPLSTLKALGSGVNIDFKNYMIVIKKGSR